MKIKLFTTIIALSILLIACTSAPQNSANQDNSLVTSTSIVEVDRTEEYVEIMRETLIEVYDYDIKEPVEDRDVRISYGKNLTDEFKAEKKHSFEKDFKRIILETPMLPFQVIEFFEFTDQKDFDKCKDWIEQRFTDADLLKSEEALFAYPNIVLIYSNDDKQEDVIKIIESKLSSLNLS